MGFLNVERKLNILVTLFLFLSILMPILQVAFVQASPKEIHVYSGQSLYTAVSNAMPGDTIVIHEGIYCENYLIVRKPLKIIGADRDRVILDGKGLGGFGIYVVGTKNVEIANLTIRNFGVDNIAISGYRISGISIVNSENILVRNCHLYNDTSMSAGLARGSTIGVYSSSNVTIVNCIIHRSECEAVGIFSSSKCLVANCEISRSSVGIVLSSSTETTIMNCSITDYYLPLGENPFHGVEAGIQLVGSKNNLITGCSIYRSIIGLVFDRSPNNTVKGCCVNKTLYGIQFFYNSSDNTVLFCNLLNNSRAIEVYWSQGINVHYSNIYGNRHGVKSGTMVNATHNWWGDPSGPYHESKNQKGKGDKIDADVLFEPWLTSPFEKTRETENNFSTIMGMITIIIFVAITLVAVAFLKRKQAR